MDAADPSVEENPWCTDGEPETSASVSRHDSFAEPLSDDQDSVDQVEDIEDRTHAESIQFEHEPLCTECGISPAVWYCKKCEEICDECWPTRSPHKIDHPSHHSHERVTISEHKLFGAVLNPDSSPVTSERLHQNDNDSLWFSVDDDPDSLELQEFPRFSCMLSEHQNQFSLPASPYPRLVSFVGRTGVGKSAIIRLLIEHLWDETARRRGKARGVTIKTPVVGPRQEHIPTSGDVHLYRDVLMNDVDSGRPLLYADCEGFGAGTSKPAAHGHGRRSGTWNTIPGLEGIRRWKDPAWNYVSSAFRRPLPGLGRRQDAVEHLFPKLLYNFSDVVVNVMSSQATRQIDDDIVKLLEWAETSHASATNRFGLPHLIVVINQSDHDSNWDSAETTRHVFEQQQRILEQNDRAKAIKERFENVGIRINNLEDLLLNAYASVQFIRLPRGESPFRLSMQLQRLHGMICQASQESLDEKYNRRMLLSATNMDEFFRLAFDHYSNKVKEPFDFLAQLISLRPPSDKMAARFSALLVKTFKTLSAKVDRSCLVSKFCDLLVPLVCSSMALDATRVFNNLPGRSIDIFCGKSDHLADDVWKSNQNSYKSQIAEAFRQFISISLNCEFNGKSGERCVNKYETHHCHQDDEGTIIGGGSYESQVLDELMVQWENSFHSGLEELDKEEDLIITGNQDIAQTKRNAIWATHMSAVESLYLELESLEIVDILACSWCFCNDSSEFLTCGHGICDACLAEVGKPAAEMDQRLKVVHSCSLHSPLRRFQPALQFFQLPSSIGRRILALNGDGAHGVTQTGVLSAIQRHLGDEIPIRHFFDLIGGSGTGGLLAIGLGIGGWDVHRSATSLREFEAEVTRDTAAIESAFRERITGQLMIGSRVHVSETPIRVFVATTLDKALDGVQEAAIITNYVRPEGQERRTIPYSYEAGRKFGQELTIFKAAKATCNAPSSPTPLYHRDVRYLDGGLSYNNPSEIAMSEAQLLWPSDKNTFSHLLLSVGSGWIEDADDSQNDSNGDSIIEIGRKKVNQVAEFFRFRSSQLQRRLDRNRVSEKTWNEAFCQISRKHPTRCVRLNPKLSGAQLQGTAADISTEFLAQDNTRLQISNVCHALLATTFYFNATENSCLSEYGRVTMTGKIFCRFPNGSDTIRSLSRVLERLRNPCIDLTSPVIKSWDINKTIISRMKRDGILDMPVDFQVPGSCWKIKMVFLTADSKEEPIGVNLFVE